MGNSVFGNVNGESNVQPLAGTPTGGTVPNLAENTGPELGTSPDTNANPGNRAKGGAGLNAGANPGKGEKGAAEKGGGKNGSGDAQVPVAGAGGAASLGLQTGGKLP